MKKAMAASLAFPIILASCSMPWSKESPAENPAPAPLPPVVTPVDENPPATSTGVSAPDTKAPTATGGVVDANPPSASGGTAVPPKPSGTSTGSAAIGTVDDAEVQAAVDEIDKLFDGIAGDAGPEKK